MSFPRKTDQHLDFNRAHQVRNRPLPGTAGNTTG